MQKIRVNSEISELRKVLIHSPDGGIGNVPANKLHEWLYDDIVDVKYIQKEYQTFQTLLLLFLDAKKVFANDKFVRNLDRENILVTNPENEKYYAQYANLENEKVVDTQFLLQYLLENNKQEARDLIINICATENLHPIRKKEILDLFEYAKTNKHISYTNENGEIQQINLYTELVKIFLTGKLDLEPIYVNNKVKSVKILERGKVKFIFPPIPNFIFTRDIGISIGDHILITKPKYNIRKREVILFRFIAENFAGFDATKIISVSEDDNFFHIEEKNQKDYLVSYEGGDIMMISDRHVLIGCSERTSAYATQKLVNRLFWENIDTNNAYGIDLVSVIMIGEQRSQMHIDTVFTHVREDVWVLHSPLSEIWEDEQEKKEWYKKDYNDELLRKSQNQIEKEKSVSISQFYLNEKGRKLKEIYYDETKSTQERNDAKYAFKKLDFLRKTTKDENGDKVFVKETKITNKEDKTIYTLPPKGLADLLQQISVSEFGVAAKDDVKFVLSGMGVQPYDSREQWTDACNLLTLSKGVSVGYDRNPKTALHFNEVLSGLHQENAVVVNHDFDAAIVEANKKRFISNKNSMGKPMELKHVLHVIDLFDYIAEKDLSLAETNKLIQQIKDSKSILILLPSNELSRARGGSHCMTMPMERN